MKNRNFNLESGIVMTFEIMKFYKLPSNEISQHRGRVNLKVSFEANGQKYEEELHKIPVSGLLGYKLKTDKDKFVGVQFSSKNTSPIWKENPLKLVKSEGKYFLYMVHEKGKEIININMPGGIVIPKVKWLYHEPEAYVRFLDCDALRRKPENQQPAENAANQSQTAQA